MFNKLSTAVVVASVFVLGGCANDYYSKVPTPFVSNVQNQEADNIRFEQKLQREVDNKFASAEVKVVADHFNVLVIGQAPNKSTKDSLLKYIKQQYSTGQVFDYITIAAKPSLDYNSSLVDEVSARLSQEQDIDASKVTVAAVGGVVYLLGTNVGDLTHLERAIRGIYAIDGVDKVINLVQQGPGDYFSTK